MNAASVARALKAEGFVTSHDRKREGIRVKPMEGGVRVSVDLDSPTEAARLRAELVAHLDDFGYGFEELSDTAVLIWAMPEKIRCGFCETMKPERHTTLVHAMIGGDYRRAARRGERRICRECVQGQVDYARREQEKGYSVPVNTGRVTYEYAARKFGIDISGLLLDRMTGRREPVKPDA